MKLYRINHPGSLAGLELCDAVQPEPGQGQVVVKMRAAALNFRDLMIVNDYYVFPTKPGLIPLCDGAGEVVAIGEGVTRFGIGDAVLPNFLQKWIGGKLTPDTMGFDIGGALPGVLAQYIVLDQEGLVAMPSNLSFHEGASLACAGLTAWNGLVGQEPIFPGDVVLVQGTGGVSLFALQFAKLFGARVIATTSSAEKVDYFRKIGADDVINYVETPEWDKAVQDLTGGRGVDRVIEVGGPSTLERSARSLRIGGRISAIGFVAGIGEKIDPVALIARQASLDVVAAGSRSDFEKMNRAIAQHGLHPVIDKVFAFEAARDAYEHLTARRHVGKVVIDIA